MPKSTGIGHSLERASFVLGEMLNCARFQGFGGEIWGGGSKAPRDLPYSLFQSIIGNLSALRGTELVVFTETIFEKQITICADNTGGSKTHTHRLFLDGRRGRFAQCRRFGIKAFVSERKVDRERDNTGGGLLAGLKWTISSVCGLFMLCEHEAAVTMHAVRA